MRIYLPATVALLSAAVRDEVVRPVLGHGFGVTDDLRHDYPGADDEELEYLAMQDASRASLRLLADEGDVVTPLRVVIAVDAAADANPVGDRSSVLVHGDVAWKQVAAVHLDGADAAEAVRAAVGAVHEADLGDEDAEFTLGAAEDFELAWYAPDEVTYLVTELGA